MTAPCRSALAIGLAWAPAPGQEPVAAPPITALAFAPGGTELVVGSQAGVEVRAWPGLERVRSLETELAHVHDLAFSPDGRTLALAGGRPSERGAFELRAWPSGELAARRADRDDLIYAVSWSPDSALVLCCGHDARATLHDARDGAVVSALHGHLSPVLCGCFTPDGATVVTGSADSSLRTWHAATGERQRVLENHTEAVHDLALRPAGSADELPMVASAGADGTVRLWQPTIGRLVRFARLPSRALALEWSRDGAYVLVASVDGRLRVIDPDTVAVVATLDALDGWAYSLAVPPADGSGVLTVAVAGLDGRVEAVRVAVPSDQDRSETGVEGGPR